MHALAATYTSASGLDEIIYRALNLAGTNPAIDAIMIFITILGAAYIIALIVIPIWWRGDREAAFDFLIVLGVAIVVAEAIKYAVGRPRPCEVLSNVHSIAGFSCDAEFDPSFPSGHASRAFAVATFLGLRYRWKIGSGAMAFAVLVGLGRIYLGVHWPSDVLAGAVLGAAVALVLARISRRSNRYLRVRTRILEAVPHRRTRSMPP